MAVEDEGLLNLNVAITQDLQESMGPYVRGRFTITVARPGVDDLIFGATQGPEDLMERPQLRTKV